MKKTVKILNCEIMSISRQSLLHQLTQGVLITPNVDHLISLQRDREMYNIYNQAEWVVCDSEILQLGLKFLGMPVKEVIQGSSFLPSYYTFHKDNPDIRIFLLGAAEGVAIKAMNNINNIVGRKMVIGAHSPSYGFEKNESECYDILKIINESGANVLVVGVGTPKQEKWIFKYKDQLPYINVFMGLGATIDFEAGNIKRAPVLVQKLYFEWLYRLIKEPHRLWKRYLVDDMPFFYYIIKQKFGLYKDPFEKQIKVDKRIIT